MNGIDYADDIILTCSNEQCVEIRNPLATLLFLRMNYKNMVAEPKIVKGPPCKLFLCLADLNYRTRDVIKLRRWKLYQQRRNMLPYFISPTVCLCSGVKILYLISQVASSHCVPCSGDIYCGGRSAYSFALTHESFELVAIQQCIDSEISSRTLCLCVWK